MPVTPILPLYRVQINFTADGLPHKQQIYCGATPASVTPSGFNMLTRDSSALETDAAVQAWCVLLEPCLPSAATFQAWELQVFSGGAYLTVFQNAIAAVASGVASRSVASRMTVTMRDTASLRFKNILLGVDLIAPQHGPRSAMGGVYGTLATAMTAPTGNNFGNWAMSRGAHYPNTVVAYTVSLDRKSRRRLGLI